MAVNNGVSFRAQRYAGHGQTTTHAPVLVLWPPFPQLHAIHSPRLAQRDLQTEEGESSVTAQLPARLTPFPQLGHIQRPLTGPHRRRGQRYAAESVGEAVNQCSRSRDEQTGEE